MKKLILSACLLLTQMPVCAAPMVELAAEAQLDASGEYQKLQEIEAILQSVIQIRGLELKHPVQVNTIDREQLRQKILSQIEQEIPPEKIAAEEALYKHLGMLPMNFDYRQFLVDLYTEQIGGFYDPKTKELRLIKSLPLTGLEQQMLIAHELTHALQDQHYNLQDYLQSESDNDDKTLAHMALIEGDATLAASEFIQKQASERPVSGFLDVMGSVFNAIGMTMRFEKFRTAPRFIREGLVFPYDQGTQFVSAFRQKGWSWQEMSLLYERPPLSTEQIMHVGAYLNEDSPEAIQFSLINDWPQSQRTSSNVWGELGYRQYFRHHLSSKEAYKAASGWQGDRYEVLKQADHYAFALISHWESPTEAEEFLNAYRQSLALRYKTQTRDYAGGTLVAADKKFSTWIGRKASEVVVLEHIPQEQLEPLIETFLKRRWN